MLLGAITMKFGMTKHKKIFSRMVKKILIFLRILYLLLELKM